MNLPSSDTAHQPRAFENLEHADPYKLQQAVKIQPHEAQLNNAERIREKKKHAVHLIVTVTLNLVLLHAGNW